MEKKLIYFLKTLLRILALVILIPLFIISLQYFKTVIYKFERPEIFHGSSIYNPYKNMGDSLYRANFHCHSLAWAGVTHGNQPPGEVYGHYYENGYDVVGLSNYQQISPPYKDETFIPTYEHGVNIKLNHHIVLNSHKPSYADFFLWQNAHQKQLILKKLKENGGLIAIAHPRIRKAFHKEDMWKLRGFDFIEALNHYKKSFSIWDAALSSGNLCWLMANDDSHNVYKDNETFINWNMIGAEENTRESILAALKKGCHYGVNNRQEHTNSNYFDSARVIGNTVHIYFKYPAEKIEFIGDHGVTRKTVLNQEEASYLFSPEDTYIRVKANTKESTIYLNPFFRYDGNILPKKAQIPKINIFLTILYRIQSFLISSLLLVSILLVSGYLQLAKKEKGIRLSFKWVNEKKGPISSGVDRL